MFSTNPNLYTPPPQPPVEEAFRAIRMKRTEPVSPHYRCEHLLCFKCCIQPSLPRADKERCRVRKNGRVSRYEWYRTIQAQLAVPSTFCFIVSQLSWSVRESESAAHGIINQEGFGPQIDTQWQREAGGGQTSAGISSRRALVKQDEKSTSI
ncbi:hypothetical protein EYF80_050592 [Liparis tanakae]|uniref:Uncharacterized protein n=1 Tax=Liparis tanakae TaxID=230148 RepID=A0A4Z2FEQ3_9TELE|nr:hypothetical protein EYF80_050592 [Liparis tanakae]